MVCEPGHFYQTQLTEVASSLMLACPKRLTCHIPGWADCRIVLHASLLSHPLVLSGLQQLSGLPALSLHDKLSTVPSDTLLTLKRLTLACTHTHTHSYPPANPLLIYPLPLSSNISFCWSHCEGPSMCLYVLIWVLVGGIMVFHRCLGPFQYFSFIFSKCMLNQWQPQMPVTLPPAIHGLYISKHINTCLKVTPRTYRKHHQLSFSF